MEWILASLAFFSHWCCFHAAILFDGNSICDNPDQVKEFWNELNKQLTVLSTTAYHPLVPINSSLVPRLSCVGGNEATMNPWRVLDKSYISSQANGLDEHLNQTLVNALYTKNPWQKLSTATIQWCRSQPTIAPMRSCLVGRRIFQSTSIDFSTSIFMTTYDDDAKLQEVLQVMAFFVYMDNVILHI